MSSSLVLDSTDFCSHRQVSVPRSADSGLSRSWDSIYDHWGNRRGSHLGSLGNRRGFRVYDLIAFFDTIGLTDPIGLILPLAFGKPSAVALFPDLVGSSFLTDISNSCFRRILAQVRVLCRLDRFPFPVLVRQNGDFDVPRQFPDPLRGPQREFLDEHCDYRDSRHWDSCWGSLGHRRDLRVWDPIVPWASYPFGDWSRGQGRRSYDRFWALPGWFRDARPLIGLGYRCHR